MQNMVVSQTIFNSETQKLAQRVEIFMYMRLFLCKKYRFSHAHVRDQSL